MDMPYLLKVRSPQPSPARTRTAWSAAHLAALSIPSLWPHDTSSDTTHNPRFVQKYGNNIIKQHSKKYAQLDSSHRETQYPLATRVVRLAIFGKVVSVPLAAIALSDAEEAEQHHASTRSPGRIVPLQGSARPLHVPATAPLDGDA